MKQFRSFEVTDVHVGGEVHRIILNGIAPLPGNSIREQALFLERKADGLRRLLLYEPYGGLPSLSADLVVEPYHSDAQVGVIIMEFMGYPPYSGSNIMATVLALVDSERISIKEGENIITLETTGGLVQVLAQCHKGRVIETSYISSCLAYLEQEGQRIEVSGYGTVEFDIVWSGVFYPVIDASSRGFDLTKDEEQDLRQFCYSFIETVRPRVHPVHSNLGDVGPLSFVLLVGPVIETETKTLAMRVATYVHPNSMCRCSSGTGTTAAITQLTTQGRMHQGDTLCATSWFGTNFYGTILNSVKNNGRMDLEVSISSTGSVIARVEIIVDLNDPLVTGPGLKELLQTKPLVTKFRN